MTITSTAPAVGSAAPPGVNKPATLTIILAAYFMILLDNSVIFTALPSLQAGLDLSPTGLAWVQDAYTLVFGGLLLLGSRTGDLLGRRAVFVAGLAVFTLASFCVGMAPSGGLLIAARALQGVGAAVVAPSSLSLLTASFPEGRERTKAVAWYGATAGIGASLGLVIGGACAAWISWRAGFFINVPVGIAMMVLAPRFLPETARRTGRFDLAGALCATGGVTALVFGIMEVNTEGWSAPQVVAPLVAGVLLLSVLVGVERRADQPIMPLGLFADRERAGAYLARLFYMGAMIGFFFFITRFLQGVLGFSPLQAGLAFLPMTAVNFAVALRIPALVRRFGSAPILVVGVAFTLAGMVWLGRLDADSAYWSGVAVPMLLIGVGQGLAFAPLTASGIARARADQAGAASGLVNTFHQMGMSLGLAVLVTTATSAATGPTSAAQLAAEVGIALTTGAVLLGLSLIVTTALILPTHREERNHA